MKLKYMEVNKLHGDYNYKVKFNDDITILYGSNGSGKTTILNILSYILSGKVFKLVKFKFNSIRLIYKINDLNKHIEIRQTTNEMKIVFNGQIEKYELDEIKEYSSYKNHRYLEDNYIHAIKKEFEFVYLPLNRINNNIEYEDRNRRYNLEFKDTIHNSEDYLNYTLELIKKSFFRITNKTNLINTRFRNQILKKLLDLDSTSNMEELLPSLFSGELTSAKIKNTQKKYLKILEQFEISSDLENKKYADFFENLINLNDNKKENKLSIDFVYKYAEYSKITKLLEFASVAEKDKIKAQLPLVRFEEIINSFFMLGQMKKTINVRTYGKPIVKDLMTEKKLEINALSSGEKQIVNFFANLIFKVENKDSIFIVDEPELSLHLAWQRIFLENVIKTNNNTQIIFATHSPEIIGKYRTKMTKLQVEVD